MKINKNIHLSNIKLDDFREALNYAYFFKKYCYISDGHILMRINKRDFFTNTFDSSKIDEFQNRMVRIQDLAMLYNKDFKIIDNNIIVNDTLQIKTLYYPKQTKKISESKFESLLQEREKKDGPFEYSRHMKRAINLFTSEKFAINDLGMKAIITHSSKEYVNDIEIMVMKKYIG